MIKALQTTVQAVLHRDLFGELISGEVRDDMACKYA